MAVGIVSCRSQVDDAVLRNQLHALEEGEGERMLRPFIYT